MKLTTAVAVVLMLVAPVPPLAGLIAYGVTVVCTLSWALRTT